MEVQHIKNFQLILHSAWLGLGLSSSDLLLLVLVLLTKLIASVMTLFVLL